MALSMLDVNNIPLLSLFRHGRSHELRGYPVLPVGVSNVFLAGLLEEGYDTDVALLALDGQVQLDRDSQGKEEPVEGEVLG